MTSIHSRKRALVHTWLVGSVAIWLFLLMAGTVHGVAQPEYTPVTVGDVGTINGRVVLGANSFKPAMMEVLQDNKSCGKGKQSPRLIVGKDQGVSGALVYLEGISSGKRFAETKDYLLEQKNCEYSPHVMVVPVGTKLNIVNNDAVLHNVHCYDCTKDLRTIFNIAQPVKGLKSCTKSLDTPGLLTLSCDAGHPWMSAYVMVAKHPYYAVTDKNGNFSLDNIPPGNYTLHMWHEGISISKKELEHEKVKKYEYEEPYEQSMQVTVSPKSTTTTNFTLVLR